MRQYGEILSRVPWIGSANSFRNGVNVYKFGDARVPAVPGSRLDILLDQLKREFPELRFQRKRAHWYWRALHWLVLIITFGKNREFLERYTTTIGYTIAFSEHRWQDLVQMRNSDRVWALLRHEREHLRQFKKHSRFGMGFLYLLVLPTLFAFYRTKFELEGFKRTLEGWFVLDRRWAESAEAREWWVKRFTSGAYARMWIVRSHVERWFDDHLLLLKTGQLRVK